MKLQLFLLGVVFPMAAMAAEWELEYCYANCADPWPTPLHGLMLLSVPCVHGLYLCGRRGGGMGVLSGFALAICLVYTLMFLPIVPLAILIAPGFPLALCGLAPPLALWATLQLVSREGPKRSTWWGIALALAALGLGSVPLALTRQWMQSGDVAHLRDYGVRRQMFGECLQHTRTALDFTGVASGPNLPRLRAQKLFLQVWGHTAKHEPLHGNYPGYPIMNDERLFHPSDARATPEPGLAGLVAVAALLSWRRRRRCRS